MKDMQYIYEKIQLIEDTKELKMEIYIYKYIYSWIEEPYWKKYQCFPNQSTDAM
jgi:hypothetical protein